MMQVARIVWAATALGVAYGQSLTDSFVLSKRSGGRRAGPWRQV